MQLVPLYGDGALCGGQFVLKSIRTQNFGQFVLIWSIRTHVWSVRTHFGQFVLILVNYNLTPLKVVELGSLVHVHDV